MSRAAVAIVLAAGAGVSLAQSPWVVPPAFAAVEGTGSANFIYNAGPRTYQFTFPGSDFAGAPGLTIVGFSHRLRLTTASSWPLVDAVFTNYDVYVGELANTTGVLDGTFANNIVAGTDVQVRSGGMTIPVGSAVSNGTLPNPFMSHMVDFQTPFVVDPAKKYIVTVRHTGHGASTQSWDRVLSGGDYAGRSASTYAATTGGTLANVSIPQFWVTTGAAPCYPNCDGSTTAPILNVQDFGCFLNAFANGDSYANCDGSTTAPVLNVQDFGCFLNSFAAGCS
jgi:hypothetical protein